MVNLAERINEVEKHYREIFDFSVVKLDQYIPSLVRRISDKDMYESSSLKNVRLRETGFPTDYKSMFMSPVVDQTEYLQPQLYLQ